MYTKKCQGNSHNEEQFLDDFYFLEIQHTKKPYSDNQYLNMVQTCYRYNPYLSSDNQYPDMVHTWYRCNPYLMLARIHKSTIKTSKKISRAKTEGEEEQKTHTKGRDRLACRRSCGAHANLAMVVLLLAISSCGVMGESYIFISNSFISIYRSLKF